MFLLVLSYWLNCIYFFFQAGAFMGCAITSAVFGGIIIICFAISITQHHYYSWYYDLNYWYNYDAEMAISAITLVLGIVEFAIGIWAAVLSCYITSCSCCVTSPEQVSGYFWFLCFRYSFFRFCYIWACTYPTWSTAICNL